MENILKIIYDRSINNKIIQPNDIDMILEILIRNKRLNNYILNIDIQPIRSNNLASYSHYSKKITIYSQTIEHMLKNIETNTLNINDFEKILYKNLSLLQIILHEVEHANQRKISYNENTLEAFIIRITNVIDEIYFEKLYEFNPQERLAEIKSYDEIIDLLSHIKNNINNLSLIFETEKLQRLMRGYHYNDEIINSPIITFFIEGKHKEILQAFDWYATDTILNVDTQYTLNERLNYGFPITKDEYSNNMKKLILSLNYNFKDRINLKL